MLCKLYIISFFIPLEAYFNLGGLRLEPYRVLLIVGAVIFFSGQVKRDEFSKILEWYILCTFVSLAVNHDVATAFKTSGILYLEVVGSYLMGVMYVKNEKEHKTMFQLIVFMFTLLIIPSLLEFFTGSKFIHKFFERITGHVALDPNLYTESYIRLGLTRTTSVFSHPIMYAVVVSLIIPIVVSINNNDVKKSAVMSIKRLAGLVMGIITPVASAGISALVIQIAMRWWYKKSQTLGGLRDIIIAGVWIIPIVIQFGSNRGFIKFLAMSLTFNPHTAYYRILQWEFTTDDIANNIFFGIGFHEFTHPDWFATSIDSYWLLNMLQYGFFSTLCLAYFFLKMLKKTFIQSQYKKINELLLGYRVLLISIIFFAFTVDFFDKVQPLLFFVLGTASWLYRDIKIEAFVARKKKIEESKHNDTAELNEPQ